MAQKVKVTVKDDSGKETSFETKTLTALFNKLPAGTHLKVYMQENKLAQQFVGDYVTKSPPNEPPAPPEPTPTPEPEPTPEPTPTPTGTLWDSNEHGKWNDGKSRTITVKQGGQTRDDKSIFVAASGSPKLIIDGNGIAHLQAGSGGVDNLSLKGLCSHQGNNSPLGSNAPAPGEQRGGGEGFAISHTDWDAKRERFHNEHANVAGDSLPKKVEDNKWNSCEFSWRHEGSGIRLKGSLNGDNLMDAVDKNPDAWFTDPSLKQKNTYFWIRINNSDHGRIYVMAANWDAKLTMDFMFEPSKSSIALKNVRLVAI